MIATEANLFQSETKIHLSVEMFLRADVERPRWGMSGIMTG